MPIKFAPKVGEILECNYGNYPCSGIVNLAT